ncbi:MAG: EVE domain-containing protein [Chloroflexota bacterium]|nr:EVE domain-containing protein [Chloroflexota bacterium]
MNYWMLSISEENFKVTREQGYTVQGFGVRQRRKTDRMVKGDRILFYVRGQRVFPATATVASTVFEDEEPLWTSSQANERFKYRVRITADFVLPDDKHLRVIEIGPRMEYVRRWPPEMWPFALMEELHLLPRKDFEFIEEEMRKILGRPSPQPISNEGRPQRGVGGRRGGFNRGGRGGGRNNGPGQRAAVGQAPQNQ